MNEDDVRFWELIEENRAALWRFALSLTRSRCDAADLVGDTVISAHSGFRRLRDHRAFKSFLFTIAVRLNKRRVWRQRIFGGSGDVEHAIGDSHGESDHDLQLLLDALGRLPERQREALLLFEISGLTLEEIRAIQGGTLSGVKSRLLRGREALRRMLTDPAPSTPTRIRSSIADSRHFELRESGS